MSTGYIIDIAEDIPGRNFLGLSTSVLSQVGFPAANLPKLFNGQQSDVLQATQKTGLQVTVDLGSAKDVDVISILGHNFTSAAVVHVLGSTSPTFGAPTVDTTVAYNRDQMIVIYTSAPYNLRYWRVTIEDGGNNAFPWIGELIIGELIRFTYNVTWGHVENFGFGNVSMETEFGVGYRFHLNERRALQSFNFNQRPDAETAQLETMIEDAKGSFNPILMVVDDVEDPNDAVYGQLTDSMNVAHRFLEWNNVTGLNVREQARAQQIRMT